MTGYVELSAFTNFSFLEGAAHAEELVATAAALGHDAIAITDRNSLAGIARAHAAARKHQFRLVVGCRLEFGDGCEVLVYPTDRFAYGRLCELLTLGRRRAPKGECHLDYADLAAGGEGMIVIALPPEDSPTALPTRSSCPGLARPSPGMTTQNEASNEEDSFSVFLSKLKLDFRKSAYLALSHRYHGDDRRRMKALQALADRAGLPTVAVNDVRYHVPERRMLADVLTCIRHICTIDTAGYRLRKNAERHLKPEAEMRRLFRGFEAAVDRSVTIAGRCRFSMDELRYEYPTEVVGPEETAQQTLTRLTAEGARWRYPKGVPAAVTQQIAHELRLIAELDYAPYFLTVHDIVRFAREQKILHQGRGSAANSAVCYCLGITAIDPEEGNAVFERFISAARNEPPDIDVDFEHERREEVIQYVYNKYGRGRAGLAATVICYRSRGAIRDVGKAMGLSTDVTEILAKSIWGWSHEAVPETRVRELGLDPADPRLAMTLTLAHALMGFPRHLSQHVGGMVISRGPLSSLVPIENAAMADRTVIQWDKDDLESLGLMKVDILALGMLTCIRKAFDLIQEQGGPPLSLAAIPMNDPEVYEMLCRADTVGVFQVESRAQMSMLPRLKPRKLYDLTIEVAIVRPGPIQGDMVHPYLRRREGREAVEYQKPELKAVLEKTLGVPLFQEQAMKIAMVAANFTADEADGLRRAMATFRHNGDVIKYRDRLIGGMVKNGYTRDFAERCFKQIEGFGNYGFPESHAASFALLAYISAWLKCHHPAIFAAALLNSQPMGFYAPAQIVRDAIEHGVEVRPVDVNLSDWDCTVEQREERGLALRLGFRQGKGVSEAEIAKLVAARGSGYRNAAQLWRRAGLEARTLTRLAEADAFRSLELDRRQALWAVKGLGEAPLPLFAAPEAATPEAVDDGAGLPEMPLSQHVIEDYRALQLSLKRHPLGFLRARLAKRGVIATDRLAAAKNGARVRIAGLVLVRQRPGTASGVIFMTLEDETGIANLVVWNHMFQRFRRTVMTAKLVGCEGKLQVEGKPPHQVIHVVAERLVDLTALLTDLREDAAPPPDQPPMHPRDVHKATMPVPHAHADAVTRQPPRPDPRDPTPDPWHRADTLLDIRSRDFH
ncbi:MAG TPA: error-prone DNA polymerase [Candidatus Binatia bacterium]|nr:error-prone DNA polymerase [Candidatus Binatia bacterium]